MFVAVSYFKKAYSFLDFDQTLVAHGMAYGSSDLVVLPRERSRCARSTKKKFDPGIDFSVAKKYVRVCAAFKQKGHNSCRFRDKCPLLHANEKENGTTLYPTIGLQVAKRMAKDSSISALVLGSEVYVNPIDGLTSFLLEHNSPLIIDKMIEKKDCFVFFFRQYDYPPDLVKIVQQKSILVKPGEKS